MDIELSTFNQVILFIIGSVFFITVSRRALLNTKSHGFYRFFAFESILVLVLINLSYWVKDPFSIQQLFSWVLLLLSILFAAQGFHLLRKLGGLLKHRVDCAENFAFENTTRLVTNGIYKYIRHPMYSALLLLAWGAYFKHYSILGTAMAVFATLFLFLTAKCEERENIQFFGDSYTSYRKKTKMFIPYLL
ncbi:MAG: isoprenylcysteine carboxylmethyltransferase family protein [Gammaproteobacteria bacterium]|nr:isoprenylcysteine carboxylmethyltransferase family protein [Gammaproteobacteria bacterium]